MRLSPFIMNNTTISKLRLPFATCAPSPGSIASSGHSPAPRRDHTFSLPDGRTLGYAEFGYPNGYPLLYFHGYPSSRLEAWGFDTIAKNRGVRVIAPDRPGFGLSTPQPTRRINDWPEDIRALTQHLGFERFAIVGCSGGGPYALACALKLPREMMSAVGLLASAGPWDVGTQDFSWMSRSTAFAATYFPSGLQFGLSALAGSLRWVATTGFVTRKIDAWLEQTAKDKKESEKSDLTTEERREKLLGIGFEGFAQGTGETVREALLLSGDWGFKLEDVDYEKIQIWHGTADTNSPVRLARHMAERLPHSVLREFEDVNHYQMGHHLEQVLSDLIPEKPAVEPEANE